MASFVAEEVQRTYIECEDLGTALGLRGHHGFTCETYGRGAVVIGSSAQEVGRLLFLAGPGASELRRLDRTIEETYFDEIAVRHGSDRRA
ncbi:MAG: hypothetical protein ACOYEV_18840 [Candidatus Nanopelagicales bacterium]